MIERYELLPGEHSITCSIHSPLLTSRKVRVFFRAEAGKRHVAQAVEFKEENKWNVVILEKESGEIVSYYR